MKKEVNLLFSVFNLFSFGVGVEEIAEIHNLSVERVYSVIAFLPVYKKYKEIIKYDRLNKTVSPEADALYNTLLGIA